MPIPPKKLKAFAKENSKSPLSKKHDEDDDEAGGDDEEKGKGGDKGGGGKEGKDGKDGKKGPPEKKDKPNVDVDKAASDAEAHEDEEIEENVAGYDPEQDGNPPQWVTDEDKWEAAKKAVKPKWDSYDEPYSVVTYVYKQMGGGFKKVDESED